MNIERKILDKEWFCNQVQQCQSGLYRLALCMLQNPHDAEDILQDTILTAYEKLYSLRDPSKFKPWIMKILSNLANEMLRKKKNHLSMHHMDEQLPSDEKDLCSSISLWDAVKSLDMSYQSVVVLFYYEDMAIKDISTVTGLSQTAVKTRLTRARHQLKKILDKGEQL